MTTASAAAHRDESGAAIVEMAFAFTLFFTLLWGIVAFGVMFGVAHTLNSAASEAARAAVEARTDAEAITVASATADAQLAGLGSYIADNAEVPTPTVAACPGGIPAQCITVIVSYDWAANPVIPSLFSLVAPDTLHAESTIQLTQ